MRQRNFIMTAWTVFILAGSAVDASHIGVSFTPDGNDCDITISSVGPVTWYIFAYLYNDDAFCGITGAEFRQDGSPSNWFLLATPSPMATSTTGNPIAGGCTIAFPPARAA